MTPKTIYDLIAERSQAWVSGELGVHVSTVSRIATGLLPVSRKLLERSMARWDGRDGRPLFDAVGTIRIGAGGSAAVQTHMKALSQAA